MAEQRRALITGITGQDGSYLAEFLLEKGYEVHGLVRRTSTHATERLDHIDEDSTDENPSITYHYGDLADGSSLMRVVLSVEPDEVYNLAAQSHVHVSFQKPVYTMDVTALGVTRLLEAVVELNKRKPVRFYQASSSEMYGAVREVPQTEATPFYPQSPYACAKVCAFHQTVNYRDAYGLFTSNGILFNHESPRRGEQFVTRKISRAVARIREGLQDKLFLGNLDAKRDWGYARDYVEAMWMMLQHDEPDDFVIATGETHSVREFLESAFACVGLDWQDYVEIDSRLFRPAEVHQLLGDASKARETLGWETRTSFEELVRLMVEADCCAARDEIALRDRRGAVRG
jgi:GDPmannose 4,6-dehydratase